MEQQAPRAYTGWITLGNGEQRELAGMGRRLWARIIDFVLLGLVALIAIIALFGLLADSERGFLVALFLGILMVLAIWILYEPMMIAAMGQTLGKKWAGVKVVRADDGAVPGWGKSFVRWLIPSVVNLIPILGGIAALVIYISPLFTPTRQGWHDMAASTAVLKADQRAE